MERKVPFLKSQQKEPGAKWYAQHIELSGGGIAILVICDSHFATHGETTTSVIEGSIIVSHYGRPLLEMDASPEPFLPKSVPGKYFSPPMFSIGGQKLSIGFGGRAEVRESGWLPKYLYIKIER